MKVIEHIDNRHENIFKVRFRADASTVNALRRIMYREVPTVAVDEVVIHINESIHHDLYLADRIRLVTLKTNVNRIQKGDIKEYSFDYVNDSSDAEDDGYTHITAKSIFGKDAVNSSSVIVKLKNTEHIHVTVRTVVGVGASHSKHYPVAPASFHLVEEDTKDNDRPLYDFTIDSTRSLPAETILDVAVEGIIAKLKGVRTALGRIEKKDGSEEAEID